jgi:RHS repeat-associated protein
MKTSKCFLSASFLVLSLAQSVRAQVNPGLPPLNDFSNGKFDVVNISNRNIFFRIPVREKAGAIPFSAALVWNINMSVNGGGAWVPPAYQLSATVGVGIAHPSTTTQPCGSDPHDNVYSNFVYIDGNQTSHLFGIALDGDRCLYPSGTASGPALDNSGYTMIASTSGSYPSISVYDVAGNYYGSSDPNGNFLTYSSSNGIVTDTDTLGETVLTVSQGAHGTPDTYSYTDAVGATRTVTVNKSSYTLQTNFGCGLNITYPSTWLPISIVMPDGSSYGITYETTLGYPNSVTGRITKITLPTGGSISYSYTGGPSNQGLECPSDYVPILIRTLTNSDGSTAVWKYDGQTLAAPQVLVTDPYNNDTVYTFGANLNYGEYNYGFESQKLIYSGLHSGGTLLQTVVTCYNGNTTNCATTSPMAGASITEKDTTATIAGMTTSSQSKLTFNSNGLITEDREYDFGASTPTTDRTLSYGTYSGGSCSSLGPYIHNRVCSDVTKNGTGAVVAQTNNSYDANGNLTTTSSLVSGSTYLTKSFTHNANGTVAIATDVNGAQSTSTYGACNGLMPTSIAEPLSLSVSMTWDCNGGVMTSRTDENGQTTYFNYSVSSSADPYWRMLQVKDPLGNVTNFTYGVNSTESVMVFNNGASTVDALTTTDGLGQSIVTQKHQAPGSANWDTVSRTYDKMGRVASVSQPCASTTGAPCPATPATTFQYDAASRPLLTTDAGNGTVSYSYSKNDALITVGPAPAGENTKRKQNEYNALGRVTSVCEITSASGSGAGPCGQASPQTGLLTKYTYDALGKLLNVTQNAQPGAVGGQQSRTYGYDSLRLTSETNPETGTATYTYDTDSVCGTSQGDLVKKVDALGNVTCMAYDGLHRNTAITYPSGPYAAATASKSFIYDATTFSCANGSNVKGQLAEAFSGPSTAKVTDVAFCYSPRSEVTDVYESTSHSAGHYHTTASYWANGALLSLGGIPGYTTTTYGVDGEGRLTFAQQGTTPLVCDTTCSTLSTTYNPAGQVHTINIGGTGNNGSGDNDSYTYDPATGRMTNYAFTIGSAPKSMTGALQWNPNGTLAQLAIADGFHSGGAETCNYGSSSVMGYDDLGRLLSANCGSVWAQTFNYDPFGNITKSGSIAWQPGYNQSNQYLTPSNCVTLGGTPCYDGDGNLIRDGSNSYTWDASGKMASINSGNSPAACGTSGTCLTYDAFGRMVEANASGTYTEMLYSPVGKTANMSGSSTVNYSYIPLPGGATMYSFLSGGTARYFQHKDWLGSARLESGIVNRTEEYDRAFAPFGEAYDKFDLSSGVNFTGDTQDISGVLFDTPNRELQPNQGRWISPDPAGLAAVDPTNPQSWNRYAYVLNNPLSLIDPAGLDCVYLNDAGTGVDEGGFDHSSTQEECWDNGGYWADGYVGGNSWVQTFSNTDSIIIESSINGFLAQTVAGSLSDGGTAYSQMFSISGAVDLANNDSTLDNRANALIAAVRGVPGLKKTTLALDCLTLGVGTTMGVPTSVTGAPSYPGLPGTAYVNGASSWIEKHAPALSEFLDSVFEKAPAGLAPLVPIASTANTTARCYNANGAGGSNHP